MHILNDTAVGKANYNQDFKLLLQSRVAVTEIVRLGQSRRNGDAAGLGGVVNSDRQPSWPRPGAVKVLTRKNPGSSVSALRMHKLSSRNEKTSACIMNGYICYSL